MSISFIKRVKNDMKANPYQKDSEIAESLYKFPVRLIEDKNEKEFMEIFKSISNDARVEIVSSVRNEFSEFRFCDK